MNLKDLIYFNHLAESLSFTVTAKHFYISQPSISMAIKRLEDELDTQLINRKRIHKSIHLTETGEILLKHSNNILRSIDEATGEIHDFKNQIVYFGFLPTIGGNIMSQLMPYLGKFSASMKLIEEESSDVMLDLVRSGQVPLAIIGSDQELFNDDTLLQIPLKQEQMALWVAKNNPLATRTEVTATDVQKELFISLETGYTHHRIFERWMRENNILHSQTLYTKEIQTALSIASSTNMLAFLSDILVADYSELVRIPIQDGPLFQISLIVNKKMNDPKHVQTEFNQLLIELAKAFKEGQL